MLVSRIIRFVLVWWMFDRIFNIGPRARVATSFAFAVQGRRRRKQRKRNQPRTKAWGAGPMYRKKMALARGLLGGAAPIGAFRPPPAAPGSRAEIETGLPVARAGHSVRFVAVNYTHSSGG